MTIFNRIKTGFWVGIGICAAFFVVTLITKCISYVYENTTYNTKFDSPIEDNFDLKKQIEITNNQETKLSDRVLILGDVTNNGPKEVDVIWLQAEFFDENGSFLLECSNSVRMKLVSSDKENFQINCTYGKGNPFPAYKSYTLRVTSAANY